MVNRGSISQNVFGYPGQCIESSFYKALYIIWRFTQDFHPLRGMLASTSIYGHADVIVLYVTYVTVAFQTHKRLKCDIAPLPDLGSQIP